MFIFMIAVHDVTFLNILLPFASRAEHACYFADKQHKKKKTQKQKHMQSL